MGIIAKAREYLTFSWQEVFAILLTSIFASFILTFNEWGDEAFDRAEGLTNWGLVLVFLFFVIMVTVLISKLWALRIGYVIKYESHMVGLFGGLGLTLLSAGAIPLFLPGGYNYDRPQRLKIGHWRPHHKGWELGLIASSFPLIMLLWTLLFNPLYLFTGHEFYLHMTVAVCLTALYAMIPLPNITSERTGNVVRDWWQYLKGTTFGLEVWYVSLGWWVALTLGVVLYALIVFILIALGSTTGVIIYLLTLLGAFLAAWVYRKFWQS